MQIDFYLQLGRKFYQINKILIILRVIDRYIEILNLLFLK